MKKERLIYVLLLSAVLLVLSGFLLPKPDTNKIIYERYWAYKTHRKDKHDIVIVGDSRAYRGVSPIAMNDILPDYRIFNFGYSSGRLTKEMYRQAEKRLDVKGKRIVVLAVAPNTLTKHPNENNHINSQLLLPKEEIYQRIYFAPFLQFFTAVKPEDFTRKKKKKEEYIEEYHDDGWVESYIIPEDTTKALSSYKKWFTKVDVSPKLVGDLIKQTRIWSEKDIMVFAYRPPSSFTMENMEDSLSNFKQDEFIVEFENAGGKWIETNTTDYHSYDGSHLHKDSAIKLSKYIAREIKKY